MVRPADRPRATLVLGHGAGGGTGTPDLLALGRALPGQGVSVVLVDQPWLVAGRKVAAPPPQLDLAWLAVVPALAVDGPLLVGGRSAGARVACRTARDLGAVGCVALAFPLHPPGRPERSRLPELVGAGVPTLVVQGGNDPFGGPAQFPDGPGAGATGPVRRPLLPGGEGGAARPSGRLSGWWWTTCGRGWRPCCGEGIRVSRAWLCGVILGRKVTTTCMHSPRPPGGPTATRSSPHQSGQVWPAEGSRAAGYHRRR